MSLPICECGHESFAHYSRYGAGHCCVSSCLCERFNEPAAAPTATLSDAAERRTYALLQAAATLFAANDVHGFMRSRFEAVVEAKTLLAIIEQRQTEGK